LGVGHDETTDDGKVTLEHAECLAACDYAPVVTVNYEFYDQQTPESAHQLLLDLRGGKNPAPTRGAPLCTFKQIERQLAGFFDQDAETAKAAVEADSTGEPTLVGVRIAADRGETAPSYDPAAPIRYKTRKPDDATHPVLTKRWLSPTSWTLKTYEQLEGYQALRKAFRTDPDEP